MGREGPPTDTSPRSSWRFWLFPLVGLTATAWILFLVGFWVDYLLAPGPGRGLFATLFGYDTETIQNSLANLAQAIAAILGIAITVVSIIVQLAATRYTPSVAEMFFRDRTNLAVLSFFVIAGTYAMWVAVAVSRDVLPRVSITVTMIFLTTSLMLLVPYFAYVFDFMDPGKVIARIRDQAVLSARARTRAKRRASLQETQHNVLAAIEQLADIGVNAVSQKDRGIAAGVTNALMGLATLYLREKASLEPSWFEIGPELRKNPDFVAMTDESLRDLGAKKTWVEFKILRQFETLFGDSVKEMRDVARVVAINTRYIGEAALRAGDREVLVLVTKFFNTYLRVTINTAEVRTAYNVLNQYRLLVENVLRFGWDEIALEFAKHLSYYGQLAQSRGLGFVTETAAYDLCALCETAFSVRSKYQDAMLRVFLEVDRESESAEQELALRGVRKAQVKLATFYLLQGATELARAIQEDMATEKAERLASIRDELMAITTKDFWEVIDRGSNFDYLEPERKERLATFFSWFPQLKGGSPTNPG